MDIKLKEDLIPHKRAPLMYGDRLQVNVADGEILLYRLEMDGSLTPIERSEKAGPVTFVMDRLYQPDRQDRDYPTGFCYGYLEVGSEGWWIRAYIQEIKETGPREQQLEAWVARTDWY